LTSKYLEKIEKSSSYTRCRLKRLLRIRRRFAFTNWAVCRKRGVGKITENISTSAIQYLQLAQKVLILQIHNKMVRF